MGGYVYTKRVVTLLAIAVAVVTCCLARPALARQSSRLVLVPCGDLSFEADIVRVCGLDLVPSVSVPDDVDVVGAIRSGDVDTLARVVSSGDWMHVSSEGGPYDIELGYYVAAYGGRAYVFCADGADVSLVEKPRAPTIEKRVSDAGGGKSYSGDDVMPVRVGDRCLWTVVLHMAPTDTPVPVTFVDRMDSGSRVDTSSVSVTCDSEPCEFSVVSSGDLRVSLGAPAGTETVVMTYSSVMERDGRVGNVVYAVVDGTDTAKAYAAVEGASSVVPTASSSVVSSVEGHSGTGPLSRTGDWHLYLPVAVLALFGLPLCVVGLFLRRSKTSR